MFAAMYRTPFRSAPKAAGEGEGERAEKLGLFITSRHRMTRAFVCVKFPTNQKRSSLPRKRNLPNRSFGRKRLSKIGRCRGLGSFLPPTFGSQQHTASAQRCLAASATSSAAETRAAASRKLSPQKPPPEVRSLFFCDALSTFPNEILPARTRGDALSSSPPPAAPPAPPHPSRQMPVVGLQLRRGLQVRHGLQVRLKEALISLA